MAQIGLELATNAISATIVVLVQTMKDVKELEGNLQILETDFSIMEAFLNDIRDQFQDQQRSIPGSIEICLKKMDDALGEAKHLIDRAKQHRERGWCLRCCCFLCNPNIPTEVRAWETKFNGLFQELKTFFSIHANASQVVSTAAPEAELLLQPVPEGGFIGLRFRSAQGQLQAWLTEPQCPARVIGVYGMAGVGKTSLLKVIYNTYKQQVSGIFDVVLWFTVSDNFKVKELQNAVAKALNLKLDETSSTEERKMRLYASLQKKKFLIVLDDIWTPIDLINTVGIGFGSSNGGKIIISTRNREVIERMGTLQYSMIVDPLSTDEGWELFRRGAFTNGVVPESNIDEATAREIALECKGLPLAITVVAAAMSCKKTDDEWRRALTMMKIADPSFPTTHRTIDAELYQPLRWSYNDLSDPNLQICFLYCAAFPEDEYINVEDLVQMWSGERLISQREQTYFMDIGREYIDVLVSRCLVQCIESLGNKYRFLRIHDVLRDMAIHLGQREAHWLLEAGQKLKNFPGGGNIRDCKRISLHSNDIRDLPMDFKCPHLLSLILSSNQNLTQVPDGFLSNIPSLKVLDLSSTSISSLPKSAGQLTQLEFLSLYACNSLEDLPESICSLSHLQFLNLGRCGSLHSLPTTIGKLKNLKLLNLLFCSNLKTIPHDVFQLTSLNELILPEQSSCAVNVEDLTNLSNLRQLRVMITPPNRVGTLGPWLDMRRLYLTYNHGAGPLNGDVDEPILCESIKHMKKLEKLYLENYQGINLPNSICQLQNLGSLCLTACDQLKELPTLEIGSESTRGCFPMLKNMELRDLSKLESMIGSSNERTLSKLERLHIEGCLFGDKLQLEAEELPNCIDIILD